MTQLELFPNTNLRVAQPNTAEEKRKQLIAHLINEVEENMSERDFQRDFFESLSHQFQKKQYLSISQVEALNRIYERVTR